MCILKKSFIYELFKKNLWIAWWIRPPEETIVNLNKKININNINNMCTKTIFKGQDNLNV